MQIKGNFSGPDVLSFTALCNMKNKLYDKRERVPLRASMIICIMSMYNSARYNVKKMFIETRFLRGYKNFKTIRTFAQEGNVDQ